MEFGRVWWSSVEFGNVLCSGPDSGPDWQLSNVTVTSLSLASLSKLTHTTECSSRLYYTGSVQLDLRRVKSCVSLLRFHITRALVCRGCGRVAGAVVAARCGAALCSRDRLISPSVSVRVDAPLSRHELVWHECRVLRSRGSLGEGGCAVRWEPAGTRPQAGESRPTRRQNSLYSGGNAIDVLNVIPLTIFTSL